MEKKELFTKIITPEFAQELINGAQIICSHIFEDKEKKPKGFILLKRVIPTKEEKGDREFFYGYYEISSYGKRNLYLASEFIRMGKIGAIKRAYINYRE